MKRLLMMGFSGMIPEKLSNARITEMELDELLVLYQSQSGFGF